MIVSKANIFAILLKTFEKTLGKRVFPAKTYHLCKINKLEKLKTALLCSKLNSLGKKGKEMLLTERENALERNLYD